MPDVGVEPKISMLKRAKKCYPLNREAIVKDISVVKKVKLLNGHQSLVLSEHIYGYSNR
jgi:hypothetical protein